MLSGQVTRTWNKGNSLTFITERIVAVLPGGLAASGLEQGFQTKHCPFLISGNRRAAAAPASVPTLQCSLG